MSTEHDLRETLRRLQHDLVDGNYPPAGRRALEQRVEQAAAALGRFQLRRARAALYIYPLQD